MQFWPWRIFTMEFPTIFLPRVVLCGLGRKISTSNLSRPSSALQVRRGASWQSEELWRSFLSIPPSVLFWWQIVLRMIPLEDEPLIMKISDTGQASGIGFPARIFTTTHPEHLPSVSSFLLKVLVPVQVSSFVITTGKQSQKCFSFSPCSGDLGARKNSQIPSPCVNLFFGKFSKIKNFYFLNSLGSCKNSAIIWVDLHTLMTQINVYVHSVA